jgi:hypothetical protein
MAERGFTYASRERVSRPPSAAVHVVEAHDVVPAEID